MTQNIPMGEHFQDIVLEAGEQLKNGLLMIEISTLKITYSNKRAISLLGKLPQSLKSNYETLVDRIKTEDQEFVKEQISRLLTEKTSVEFEFHLNDHYEGARSRLICCTIYCLSKSDQLLVLVEDITKSKAQEEYLTEFGTKKNTLIETMTHHFSGALMLMRQLTIQAEQTIADSGNQQLVQYLKLLSANTESCIAMMDNLLKEEHLKSPEIAVKKFRVDIVERVNYIYENLRRAFPLRAISFETVAPSIFVSTDEFKVLQIINNFVSNAIKFTAPDKQIALSIYQTQNNVIISVEDEGIGIPEALQPFLFKKKSAAGRSGLSGELSHGFGLFISKMLAESMGAAIEFETEESKGSVFYLLIPRKGDDA